jgi:tetratricopeptide (TPR) repeat protein
MIQPQTAGSRKLLKLALMTMVAAGIGYGGIRWQKHYLRPDVVAPSRAEEEQDLHGKVAVVVEPLSVPAPSIDEPAKDEDTAESSPDEVETQAAAAQAAAAQTAAVQGYAALSRRNYWPAIGLFKRALAQNPENETALFGLAEAYRGTRQKQQALQAYRHYIDVLPLGPDARSARFQIRILESKKH